MSCCREPDLDQLLADPLIRQVMASDDVAEGDIRRLAETLSQRRAANALPAQAVA